MHSGSIKVLGQSSSKDTSADTWRMEIVSTPSTPPILLINSPHLSTTFSTSTFCLAGPSSGFTTLIRSTNAAMTASLTLDNGTLLAMRSVLSSTAALSTECPSSNARSNDCVTSTLNSSSSLLAPLPDVAGVDMEAAEEAEEGDSSRLSSASDSEGDEASSVEMDSTSLMQGSGTLSPRRMSHRLLTFSMSSVSSSSRANFLGGQTNAFESVPKSTRSFSSCSEPKGQWPVEPSQGADLRRCPRVPNPRPRHPYQMSPRSSRSSWTPSQTL